MWTLSLGQRVPFRFHLLQQLAAAIWYPWLNARLCRHCSQPMEVRPFPQQTISSRSSLYAALMIPARVHHKPFH